MNNIDPFFCFVNIKSAQKLPIADVTSSDPFVIVMLGDRRIGETSVKKRSLSPVWNESKSFSLVHLNHSLSFEVMDEDNNKDDPLGIVSVDLSTLKIDTVNDITLVLEQVENSPIIASGTLSLSIEIRSNLSMIRLESIMQQNIDLSESKIRQEISKFNFPHIVKRDIGNWISTIFPERDTDPKSCEDDSSNLLAIRDILYDLSHLISNALQMPPEFKTSPSPLLQLLPHHVSKYIIDDIPSDESSNSIDNSLFASMKQKWIIHPGDFYVQVEILTCHNLPISINDVSSSEDVTYATLDGIHRFDPHVNIKITDDEATDETVQSSMFSCCSDISTVVNLEARAHAPRFFDPKEESSFHVTLYSGACKTQTNSCPSNTRFPIWNESLYLNMSSSEISRLDNDEISSKTSGAFIFLYGKNAGNPIGFNYMDMKNIISKLGTYFNYETSTEFVTEMVVPLTSQIEISMTLERIHLQHPYYNVNTLSTVHCILYGVHRNGSKLIIGREEIFEVDISEGINAHVNKVSFRFKETHIFEKCQFLRFDIYLHKPEKKVLASAIISLDSFFSNTYSTQENNYVDLPLYSFQDLHLNEHRTVLTAVTQPPIAITVGSYRACLSKTSVVNPAVSAPAEPNIKIRLRGLRNSVYSSFWPSEVKTTETNIGPGDSESFLLAPGFDGVVLRDTCNNLLKYGNRIPPTRGKSKSNFSSRLLSTSFSRSSRQSSELTSESSMQQEQSFHALRTVPISIYEDEVKKNGVWEAALGGDSFSDHNNSTVRGIKHLSELLPPYGYMWSTDWELEEDWVHGMDFEFIISGKACIGTSDESSKVRRRVWKRDVIAVPTSNSVNNHPFLSHDNYIIPRFETSQTNWRDLLTVANNVTVSRNSDNLMSTLDTVIGFLTSEGNTSRTRTGEVLRALRTCKEKESLTSPVIIPYSQVQGVEIASPTTLHIDVFIHSYLKDNESNKFENNFFTIVISDCPAEELCELMKHRINCYSARLSMLASMVQRKNHQGASTGTPSNKGWSRNAISKLASAVSTSRLQSPGFIDNVEELANEREQLLLIYKHISDLEKNSKNIVHDKFSALELLRYRLYLSSILVGNSNTDATSYFQANVSKDLSKFHGRGQISADELIVIVEVLHKCAECRILSLAICGFNSSYNNHLLISALEYTINSFYIHEIAYFAKFFEKGSQRIKLGLMDEKKILEYFLVSDNNLSTITDVVLRLFPDLRLTIQPKLSNRLNINEFLSHFLDSIHSEMKRLSNNSVNNYKDPTKNVSGTADRYKGDVLLPWFPKRYRGEDGYFFTDLPRDSVAFLRDFEVSYSEFTDIFPDTLMNRLHSSMIFAWMLLYTSYWREIVNPVHLGYPHMKIVESSTVLDSLTNITLKKPKDIQELETLVVNFMTPTLEWLCSVANDAQTVITESFILHSHPFVQKSPKSKFEFTTVCLQDYKDIIDSNDTSMSHAGELQGAYCAFGNIRTMALDVIACNEFQGAMVSHYGLVLSPSPSQKARADGSLHSAHDPDVTLTISKESLSAPAIVEKLLPNLKAYSEALIPSCFLNLLEISLDKVVALVLIDMKAASENKQKWSRSSNEVKKLCKLTSQLLDTFPRLVLRVHDDAESYSRQHLGQLKVLYSCVLLLTIDNPNQLTDKESFSVIFANFKKACQSKPQAVSSYVDIVRVCISLHEFDSQDTHEYITAMHNSYSKLFQDNGIVSSSGMSLLTTKAGNCQKSLNHRDDILDDITENFENAWSHCRDGFEFLEIMIQKLNLLSKPFKLSKDIFICGEKLVVMDCKCPVEQAMSLKSLARLATKPSCQIYNHIPKAGGIVGFSSSSSSQFSSFGNSSSYAIIVKDIYLSGIVCMGYFSKPDSFVEVSFGDERRTTSIKSGTVSPSWRGDTSIMMSIASCDISKTFAEKNLVLKLFYTGGVFFENIYVGQVTVNLLALDIKKEIKDEVFSLNVSLASEAIQSRHKVASIPRLGLSVEFKEV